MVHRLVGERGQVMLKRPDQQDAAKNHGQVPPGGKPTGNLIKAKPNRPADDRGDEDVRPQQEVPVGQVIGDAKLLELLLELRAGERLGGG